jgi:hypothetical protein
MGSSHLLKIPQFIIQKENAHKVSRNMLREEERLSTLHPSFIIFSYFDNKAFRAFQELHIEISNE